MSYVYFDKVKKRYFVQAKKRYFVQVKKPPGRTIGPRQNTLQTYLPTSDRPEDR